MGFQARVHFSYRGEQFHMQLNMMSTVSLAPTSMLASSGQPPELQQRMDLITLPALHQSETLAAQYPLRFYPSQALPGLEVLRPSP
jgi:hypothetical protein